MVGFSALHQHYVIALGLWAVGMRGQCVWYSSGRGARCYSSSVPASRRTCADERICCRQQQSLQRAQVGYRCGSSALVVVVMSSCGGCRPKGAAGHWPCVLLMVVGCLVMGGGIAQCVDAQLCCPAHLSPPLLKLAVPEANVGGLQPAACTGNGSGGSDSRLRGDGGALEPPSCRRSWAAKIERAY